LNTIGIDIGGTKILGGVVDQEGTILATYEKPTSILLGTDAVLETVYQVISELISQFNVSAIGIGSAGRVNIETGEVYFSTPNLPNWTGLKMRELVYKKFNLPVTVDNDVNCAGIGEKWVGASKDFESSVLITLGTGVAAAVFVNGELIRGSHWSTGEIGHMILYPHGKECNCGQRGCLEQYCCGTALYKNYNEQSKTEPIKTGKEFFHLFNKGDSIAIAVLEKFVDDLAIAMVSLCNVYDPEAFIIGGGLIDTRHNWWEPLMKKINQYANVAVSHPLVRPAAFKNKAGILGAAKLGLDCIQPVEKR
jgi:glucokinase